MDGMSALKESKVLPGLMETLSEAVTALDAFKATTEARLSETLAPNGKIDRAAFTANQHAAHGFAWIVTYVETLRETANWAARLEAEGKLGDIDALLGKTHRADIAEGDVFLRTAIKYALHEGRVVNICLLWHSVSWRC